MAVTSADVPNTLLSVRTRPKERNRRLELLRHIVGEPIGAVGAALILLLLLFALAAPLISPYNPIAQDFKRLLPPSAEHLLGTDEFGRDILSRIIFGAQVSLQVGVISVGIALALGGLLGLISGYYGGTVDLLMQRVIDIVLAIPNVILVIAMAGVIGPSMATAMVAIGLAYSPRFVRVVRGATLSAREEQYVEAARSVGVGTWRIMVLHILPNVTAPLIVQATLSFSTAILVEATLSFLGLGTQPPNPSWGTMLSSGRKYMELAPGLTVFPGLAIMLAVLGFNLLGDALRDALDPRLRQR